MDIRFYKKKYILQTNGSLILTNPEPALQYIEMKINQLMSAKNGAEELVVKLEILRDFQQIYKYDLEYAERPEPFGHFENQSEKDRFIQRKTLNEEFGLYLSNIFLNFHENRYRRDGELPVLRSPRMVIDYNELYDKALSEYLNPQKSGHAVSASFICPSLIEHFLGMYLQNRMLFSSMKKLIPILESKQIELDETQRQIVQIFTGQRKEQIIFSGSQEYIMGKLYDVFTRAQVLEKTQDHEMILTGISEKRRRMLGVILHSAYAKTQIRPEYMELLINMFDTSRMNIRNSIMHGSSETFDYLAIGVVAVMMQILWDIASEDIFSGI